MSIRILDIEDWSIALKIGDVSRGSDAPRSIVAPVAPKYLLKGKNGLI